LPDVLAVGSYFHAQSPEVVQVGGVVVVVVTVVGGTVGTGVVAGSVVAGGTVTVVLVGSTVVVATGLPGGGVVLPGGVTSSSQSCSMNRSAWIAKSVSRIWLLALIRPGDPLRESPTFWLTDSTRASLCSSTFGTPLWRWMSMMSPGCRWSALRYSVTVTVALVFTRSRSHVSRT
jgi:hypothetical protein